MSTRSRIFTLALLCNLLVACMARTLPAADVAPPVTPPVVAGSAWQVVVTQSGGFAGIDMRFTAGSAGATLVVADNVRRTTTSVALSNAEQSELAQSVAQLAGGPDIDHRSASCRDCYLYEMTLTLEQGKPRRVRYDSVSALASPDTRLVERVMAIGRAGVARQTP